MNQRPTCGNQCLKLSTHVPKESGGSAALRDWHMALLQPNGNAVTVVAVYQQKQQILFQSHKEMLGVI